MDAPDSHATGKFNLLIGVTGSVATIKLRSLITTLAPHANIRVILTQHVLMP